MQVNQKVRVFLNKDKTILMTIDQRWSDTRIDRHIMEALMSKGIGMMRFERIPTPKQLGCRR